MTAPILIATAGHVDHGKSTLVRTLTGTDPDRWEEEKTRGITIDLGYAHLDRGDRTYSFVDVPGHERFIHNMLAGIGSIDGVLFVIAADESIMPQTREHALALRWLGIEQVHVVITKIDLVSDDLIELLELEVAEFLEEQGWHDAETVFFSAEQPETTGAVLDLLGKLRKKEPPPSSAFRLSIDRVFTAQGTGTVLTGTVDRGHLTADTAVNIYPEGLDGRIRQIQVHGHRVDAVGPHMRVALNLGNVHYSEIERGSCVFTGAAPVVAHKHLIRLTAFDEDWAPGPKHHFHLHHLAARRHARMLWRKGEIAAIELSKPYGLWALDRGLIRDGSPLEIRAGFEVLMPNLRHSKRRQVLPILENLPRAGDLEAWQAWFLAQQQTPFDLREVDKYCGLPLNEASAGNLIRIGEHGAVRQEVMTRYREQVHATLRHCHHTFPFFDAVPRNDVNALLGDARFPEQLIDTVLADLREAGEIGMTEDRIRLSDWTARWSAEHRAALKRYLDELAAGPLAIVDLRNIGAARDRQIERMLVWERYLINLTPDLLIHHGFLNKITGVLSARFADGPFSIPELKEAFGFTRKYAIPLLEFLDKSGLTRREGDSRVWIAREPPRFESRWQPPTE